MRLFYICILLIATAMFSSLSAVTNAADNQSCDAHFLKEDFGVGSATNTDKHRFFNNQDGGTNGGCTGVPTSSEPGSSTTYIFKCAGNVFDGEYAIVAHMEDAYNDDPWFSYLYGSGGYDHTTNDGMGRMMFINADTSTGTFYSKDTTGLNPTNPITVSFAVENSLKSHMVRLKPNIEAKAVFLPSNTEVALLTTGEIDNDEQWHVFTHTFNPPAGNTDTQMRLDIKNAAGGGQGNDFVLDDITVSQQGTCKETNNDILAVNVGTTSTVDVLANDPDFDTTNISSLINVTAANSGTAQGIITVDPATGKLTYKPALLEENSTVTAFYEVCSNDPTPVCVVTQVDISVGSALPGPDSDNDGVEDRVDLDDDNDGVLDFNEQCIGFIAQNTTGVWKGNTVSNATITWTPAINFVAGAWPVYTSQYTLHIDDNVGGAEQWGRLNKDVVFETTFDTPVPASEIAFMVMDVDTLNSNSNSTWTIEVNGIQDTTGIFRKEEMDVTYATNDDDMVLSNGVISAPVAKNDQYILIVGSDSTPVTSLRIIGANITVANDMIGYSLYAHKSCDTDGDGIANKFDLDSDNDGCFDAVEGAGTFTPTDLQAAGGTVTVGTGSPATTNQNLGNAVDGDGIPNPASPAGQNIGTSQDATQKDKDCCTLTTTADSGSGIAGTAFTVPNILTNDTVNGQTPTIGTGLEEVTVTQTGTWDTGITLDPATGQVNVANTVTAGTYDVDYQVCVNGTLPLLCKTETVTITVVDSPITANPDSGSISSTGGTAIPNVLANDTLGGNPVNSSEVTLTQVSTTNSGVTLDPSTGTVNVAPGTPAGNYTVSYQICETANPTNCETTTATVTVTSGPIAATPDSGSTPSTGGQAIANVLANDTVNGNPATTSNVTLTQVSTTHSGVTLDPSTGAVNVQAGTPVGTYTVEYQICEIIDPSNCSTATATVTVNPPISNPPTNGTPTVGPGGGGGGTPTTNGTPISQTPTNPNDLTPTPTLENVTPPTILNPSFTRQCHNILDEKTIYQGNKVTQAFRIAHQFLYSYTLTRYRGTKDFAPTHKITRQEAARFMVEFAKKVLCRTPTYKYTTQFTDLDKADPTLLPYIKQSYEYVIFHGDDGGASKGIPTTFRPDEYISQDELIAVMVRLVTNKYNEGQGKLWAQPYKDFLRANTTSPFATTLRDSTSEVIYDLYRYNPYNWQSVGYVIDRKF